MKRISLSILLLLCGSFSLAHAALPPELSNTHVQQPKGIGDAPSPGINAGGDNFGSATVIPALPYNDSGNTCAFFNDYNPPCLFGTAPDVVYRYTPQADQCVNISLCGSSFDTGLWIYDGTTASTAGCNDDFPGCGLQSNIANLALVAGHVYYIVVDGYNVACGNYQLSVTQCPPPPVCAPCPANAVFEGEPVCGDGYIDVFNGGCNSTPPVVLTLPCNPDLTICGTYGTFNANGSRDTDWYQFTLTGAAAISVSVSGMGVTGTALAIIDNVCAPTVICGQFTASGIQCSTTTCNANLGPGTYRIFTASFFDNTPCNSPYVLHIQGMACPTGVPTASWGKLKTLYR